MAKFLLHDFMIKDYIEELDSTCQDSLLTYLKHCNHKQIMKLLEDISQVFDYSYPCDINPNFAKNCTNRSICLENQSKCCLSSTAPPAFPYSVPDAPWHPACFSFCTGMGSVLFLP